MTRPFLVLVGAIGVVSLLGLLVGGAGISPTEVLATISAAILGGDPDPFVTDVILRIRAPRVLGAVAIGFGLGVAGSTMQSVYRNPVADPFLLGVSTAAGLGVILGSLTVPSRLDIPVRFVAAVVLAALAAFLLRRLYSSSDGGPGFILIGVALGFSFLALTLLLLFAASSPRLPTFAYFVFGGLGALTWASIVVCSLLVAVGCLALFRYSRSVDALTLGDRQAMALGVDVAQVSTVVSVATAIVVGATVAAAGVIGFVGLLAGFFARRAIPSGHPSFLILAGLVGSLVLLGSDVAVRGLSLPVEIPIGVVTAVFGGPLLVWALWRRRWA